MQKGPRSAVGLSASVEKLELRRGGFALKRQLLLAGGVPTIVD
jgi:hypothetical protein